MKKDKKSFNDIITKEELLEISYDMWEKSIKEYKYLLDKDDSIRNIYRDAMKYRYYHSKLTADIALNFYSKSLNITNEEALKIGQEGKILYLAALTHDIKKMDKKHSIVGAQWIEKNIGDFMEIDRGDIECISTLIRFHKSSIKSESTNIGRYDLDMLRRLLFLLKMADGVSKLKEKSIYIKVEENKFKEKLVELAKKYYK